MHGNKACRDETRYAAAILLISPLLGFLTCISSAQHTDGQNATPPNEFVRRIVTNELKAEQADHSHWSFRLDTKKQNDQTEVDEVIETKDGDLKRSILVNGHTLSAKQRQKADERIQQLVRNPGPLRKAHAEEDQDTARSQRLLKMLPDAFNFKYGQQQGDLVQLNFSPNPIFIRQHTRLKSFMQCKGVSGSTVNRKG